MFLMSDLSEEAMNAKKHQKTCGNCANTAPAIWCLCNSEAYLSNSMDASRCPNYIDGTETMDDISIPLLREDDCNRRLNNIEQKYCELERISKLMYREINRCPHYYHDVENVDYRAMLEELGVEVDDQL